jgi:rod shape-determining protein MreC
MISGFVLFFRTFPNNHVSVVADALFLRFCKSFSWIEDSLKGLYEEIRISREAHEEISRLKSEIAKLRDKTVDYYETKRENARLIKYCDLKSKDKQVKFVQASIVGHIGSRAFLDVGTFDGISVNDLVITENGLVGRVSNVNAFTSTLKTINSSKISISGEDSVTGGFGVLSGSSKSDKHLIKLNFLSSRDSVGVGNIVATSGISGMYPKNIKIGKITLVKHDKGLIFAYIDPFENIKKTKSVLVVTDFSGKGLVKSTDEK